MSKSDNPFDREVPSWRCKKCHAENSGWHWYCRTCGVGEIPKHFPKPKPVKKSQFAPVSKLGVL